MASAAKRPAFRAENLPPICLLGQIQPLRVAAIFARDTHKHFHRRHPFVLSLFYKSAAETESRVMIRASLMIFLLLAISPQNAASAADPTEAACERATSHSEAEMRTMPLQKAEGILAIVGQCIEKHKRHLAASKELKLLCERRGTPKIGMTPDELTSTCWGRPASIVKRTTAAGVEESYVYGIGHVVKVIDGQVSEIVEAR